MLTLAVDSCTERAALALGRPGELLWNLSVRLGRRHAETLQSLVEQGLEQLGFRLQDVDCFCCNRGPGSYTGLRIGLTMVKTWAYALDRPVLGLSGLDVLGRQPGLSEHEGVLALLEAGKGRSYLGLYAAGGEELMACWTEAEDILPRLAAALEGRGLERLHFAGPPAVSLWSDAAFVQRLEGLGLARGLLLRSETDAGQLLDLAWERLGQLGYQGGADYPAELRAERLTPLYLNPTQAEKLANIYV